MPQNPEVVDDTPSEGDQTPWYRRIHGVWAFPAIVVVLLVLVSGLGLNGSSISELTASPDRDPELIAGHPRAVRSDEFLVRTPLVIGQSVRGFPSTAPIGVGEHDLTVLVDLPTRDWAMLFRPHQWGYPVLPIDQAFAFDWWAISAVLLLGAYVFLLAVTGRWKWAALGSVMFWASPFFHWWYLTLSLAVGGYGLGGAGLLLMSLRPGLSRWARWLLVAGSAYLLSCFALLFYPPFQVPLILVVLAVSVGVVGPKVRSGELQIRPVLANVLVSGAVVAVVAGLFVVTRRDTLSAIMNTAYPGGRRVSGGGASSGYISSAWFGLKYVQDPDQMRNRVLSNESEGSSFLLLGVYVLAALPFLWSAVVRRTAPLRGPLIGAVVALAFIGVHMYIGLPSLLARVTLLDRAPPHRAIIGLGLASWVVAIVFGLLLSDAGSRVRPWQRIAGAAVTILFATGYLLGFGAALKESGAPLGGTATAVSVLASLIVLSLYFWRPFLGLVALTLCGLAVSLSVNPLSQGLETITEAPLVRAIERIDSASPDVPSRWLNTIDGASPLVAAAGADDLSSVNLYPNHVAWTILDPDHSEGNVWNRYAHTRWNLDDQSTAPFIFLMTNDTVGVTINPCASELDALEVGHVITAAPNDSSCLRLVDESTTLKGEDAFIYERIPSTP